MTETTIDCTDQVYRLMAHMGTGEALTYLGRVAELGERHRINLEDLLSYFDVQEKGEAGIVGISRLLHTPAILSAIDHCGHRGRWCYHTYAAAKAALDAWNGEGEPDGWHRAPYSGRRRNPDGTEYVNW